MKVIYGRTCDEQGDNPDKTIGHPEVFCNHRGAFAIQGHHILHMVVFGFYHDANKYSHTTYNYPSSVALVSWRALIAILAYAWRGTLNNICLISEKVLRNGTYGSVPRKQSRREGRVK